ncbi:MAG: aminoglycoside phosphotransferase family protein [Chloroflexota bacterium]
MSTLSQTAQFTQVVHRFEPNSNLRRWWHLKDDPLGHTTVLEVERTDDNLSGNLCRWVVRRHGVRDLQANPNIAADEFALLDCLLKHGIATATPYYLDTSCEILPTPYLIIEFMDGQPVYGPLPSEQVKPYAVQIATQMAKIHQLDVALLDVPFLVAQCEDPSKIAAKQVERFERRIERLIRANQEQKEQWTFHEKLIQAWPLPQAETSVLLHGDFWPGNLLWKNHELVAVIDWEDAHLGNPLEDFAITRFDILFIYGLEAMTIFTDTYRSLSSLDFTTLPYWDLYAALRAAPVLDEWSEGWAELGRPDLTETEIHKKLAWFVAQALDALV